MPSTFPGMDPFIEPSPYWQHFVEQLFAAMQQQLAELVPSGYSVSHSAQSQQQLVICSNQGDVVVTLIEIVSPACRVSGSEARKARIEHRRRMFTSGHNYVEIDLLRQGDPMPAPGKIPGAVFFAHVHRAHPQPSGEVTGWPLQAPLPIVEIPLRPDDADVALNLRSAFMAAYDACDLAEKLAYDDVLDPPVSEGLKPWLEECLKAQRQGGESSHLVVPADRVD